MLISMLNSNLYKNVFKNQNGFSIVQVLVAAGMAGGLAVVMMQMMGNLNKSSKFAESKVDEIELRSMVRLILSNDKFCRISLAGEGPLGSPTNPVTFQKSAIDGDMPNEGLEFELFYSSPDGESRTQKKLSATDDSLNRFGNLSIQSLFLTMNNGVGSNYPASSGESDIGEIVIEGEKRIQESRVDFKMSFPISVSFRTNAAGESTILSCSLMGEKTVPQLSASSVDYKSSTAWGSTLTCDTGQFITAMCSSGKNKDCPPMSSAPTRIGCVSDTTDSYVPNLGASVYKTGWYRNLVVCPPFHVADSLCTAGENADCNYGGTGYFAVMRCRPWTVGSSRQMTIEVHEYKGTASWSGVLSCSPGYYLTGVCVSGEHKDCALHGNDMDKNLAKVIRCSKVIE